MSKKEIRYVGYVRVSTESQAIEKWSILAQKREIEEWVEQRDDGLLVNFYVDEGLSATKMNNRPGLMQLRSDAKAGLFDAVVVHKFDRLNRNREDAGALKALLRHDYGVKVYSVVESNEEDFEASILAERIMEVMADWYSKNVSAEMKKTSREKHAQGRHLRRAPTGYRFDDKSNLVIDARNADAIRLAFELYATGSYSYDDVAVELNKRGYLTSEGKMFSKYMLRGVIDNRIYIGEVQYREMRYNSDSSRNVNVPTSWKKGAHEPLVDSDTFDKCQQIRNNRRTGEPGRAVNKVYLLRGLVRCERCMLNIPKNAVGSWGRIICKAYDGKHKRNARYYFCDSRSRNTQACGQAPAKMKEIDKQVITLLSGIKPPTDLREHILHSMAEIIGERNAENRIQELKAILKRMDERYDLGLIGDMSEYLERRQKAQMELDRVAPLTSMSDDIEYARDLLDNFSAHFQACQEDTENAHKLISLIVEEIWIYNQTVTRLKFRPSYWIVCYSDYRHDVLDSSFSLENYRWVGVGESGVS